MTWLTGNIGLSFMHNGFVRFILSSLIFLMFLVILYRVQHKLLQNKLIGQFISLISVTHYRFWGRYKSISDNKWKD